VECTVGTLSCDCDCGPRVVPRVALRPPDGGLRFTRGYSPSPVSGLKTRVDRFCVHRAGLSSAATETERFVRAEFRVAISVTQEHWRPEFLALKRHEAKNGGLTDSTLDTHSPDNPL
jgi:hypothetical protein